LRVLVRTQGLCPQRGVLSSRRASERKRAKSAGKAPTRSSLVRAFDGATPPRCCVTTTVRSGVIRHTSSQGSYWHSRGLAIKKDPMPRADVGGWLLAVVCVAVSCTSSSVERRRLADGSWHFTCRLPMDECVRHFETVCMDKRYRILNAQSRREVRDVDPGTREYRTSDITAICDRDAAELQVAAASVPPPPLISPPRAPAPACVPGATQACVGPAGCAGGQVCRNDGSGYGPCDCGAQKAPSGDAGTAPNPQ
jgi:hypothetical protein